MTHCLTRESQYHWLIYANSPDANFTVGIIRPRVLGHLFCFHFKIAFIVMCFLLFLIRNNCGCSIRVCELYLNKIEKINVFPAASCPNIWEHVIISNCRDTFIAFSMWCTFPALSLIGWSYFAKTEIILIEVVFWQYIYIRDFDWGYHWISYHWNDGLSHKTQPSYFSCHFDKFFDGQHVHWYM